MKIEFSGQIFGKKNDKQVQSTTVLLKM